MGKTVLKYALRLLPLAYMDFIWYQSGHFQPESVMYLSRSILLPLGMLFEAAHFIQFGLLYAALIFAMLTFGPLTGRKVSLALIVSAVYACIDELHQYYVPFRSASATDLIKDMIGIAAVWWLIGTSYRSAHSRLGWMLKKMSTL